MHSPCPATNTSPTRAPLQPRRPPPQPPRLAPPPPSRRRRAGAPPTASSLPARAPTETAQTAPIRPRPPHSTVAARLNRNLNADRAARPHHKYHHAAGPRSRHRPRPGDAPRPHSHLIIAARLCRNRSAAARPRDRARSQPRPAPPSLAPATQPPGTAPLHRRCPLAPQPKRRQAASPRHRHHCTAKPRSRHRPHRRRPLAPQPKRRRAAGRPRPCATTSGPSVATHHRASPARPSLSACSPTAAHPAAHPNATKQSGSRSDGDSVSDTNQPRSGDAARGAPRLTIAARFQLDGLPKHLILKHRANLNAVGDQRQRCWSPMAFRSLTSPPDLWFRGSGGSRTASPWPSHIPAG